MPRQSHLRTIILALLLTLAAKSLAPTSVQAAGVVTLSPSSSVAGQTLTVIGTDFHPSWQYNLVWDSLQEHAAGSATADASGGFAATVIAPVAGGAHVLILVQQNGTIVGSASFSTLPPATATPSTTQTAIPSATLVPTATAIPQGPDPGHPSQYCTGLFGWCPDLSGLWNALTNAIFGAITDWVGGAWNTVTSPFAAVLTTTPDLATDGAWHDVVVFAGVMQPMAGTMFVCFLVLGMLARYLTAIGRGSFTELTTPLIRAILVTGFIAGYTPIMSQVFQLLQGFASVIASAPVLGTGSGFSAIGSAFAALSHLFSISTLIDLLILLIGVIVAIIAVVIREMGLGILALCYALGPLMMITWLSPQFEFIARWWFRTFINVALWPIGYALVLKLTGALLADSGWTGLTQSLAALGCVFLLYRIPGIIGSMCGSSGVSEVATAVIGATIVNAVSLVRGAATKALGKP